MINNYQEQKELEQPQPTSAALATVAAVQGGGLLLQFDGETASDGKSYLCNTGIKFEAGDRVLTQKVGGSYIVICRIGVPITEQVADWAYSAQESSIATLASTVYNMAPGIANIQIYYGERGTVYIQTVSDTTANWTKLTGTVSRPPGL